MPTRPFGRCFRGRPSKWPRVSIRCRPDAELDAAIALHTEAGCRSSSAPVFEQHFWITQRAMAAMASRMRDTPLRRYWIPRHRDRLGGARAPHRAG